MSRIYARRHRNGIRTKDALSDSRTRGERFAPAKTSDANDQSFVGQPPQLSVAATADRNLINEISCVANAWSKHSRRHRVGTASIFDPSVAITAEPCYGPMKLAF